MIEICGVKKNYAGHEVVKGIDLKLPQGKVISFIGPNGAGKSTLLNMMARLSSIDEGTIELKGQDINKYKRTDLAKIMAILTQHNHINSKLTVKELIAFGRFPYSKGRLNTKDLEIINNALDFMNLHDFAHRYLDELSGGQRQRALIAMVLAQDTEYILLDEPTNNLDIYHASNLMANIRKLCDELGKTVIMVLHELNYASFYSDYIAAFKDGLLTSFGSVHEIMQAPLLKEVYAVDFAITNIKGKPLALHY